MFRKLWSLRYYLGIPGGMWKLHKFHGAGFVDCWHICYGMAKAMSEGE